MLFTAFQTAFSVEHFFQSSPKPHPFPLRSAFDELISPLWNSGKQQNKTVVPPIIFHHYHLPMG
jgi:hypothetical protein